MTQRQASLAVRGRAAAGDPPPGDTPCARHDPLTCYAPEGNFLRPAPAASAHLLAIINVRADAVGGRQANTIKRQTESCHIRVSEDTGALFATHYGREDCGSECPLTSEKKRTKPDTPGHPPTGLPPTRRRPTPCTTSPYTAVTTATAGHTRGSRRTLRRTCRVPMLPDKAAAEQAARRATAADGAAEGHQHLAEEGHRVGLRLRLD